MGAGLEGELWLGCRGWLAGWTGDGGGGGALWFGDWGLLVFELVTVL